MRYSDAVLSAPPGAATFTPSAVARLSAATIRLVLAPGPAAPPLEDVAAALRAAPRDLFAVAGALPPARGERLLRLSQRPTSAAEAAAAADRLVRGLFWPLVYELAPERWAELSDAETLPPDLVADLPVDGRDVLEVGAGTGRLTGLVAVRAACTVAAEPAAPLRAALARRLSGRGSVVAALTQALPFAAGTFDVVLCCAAMAPDPPLGGPAALEEMTRVSRPGGALVLVGPESPEWFVERGFDRRDYAAPAVAGTPALVDFFGPLHPPSTLLVRMP